MTANVPAVNPVRDLLHWAVGWLICWFIVFIFNILQAPHWVYGMLAFVWFSISSSSSFKFLIFQNVCAFRSLKSIFNSSKRLFSFQLSSPTVVKNDLNNQTNLHFSISFFNSIRKSFSQIYHWSKSLFKFINNLSSRETFCKIIFNISQISEQSGRSLFSITSLVFRK